MATTGDASPIADAASDAAIDAAIDATVDARPDAEIDAAVTRMVTLHVTGDPSYLAYRDGSAAWATPTAIGGADYVISVAGAYLVLAICSSTESTGADAEEFGADASEGDALAVGCYPMDQTDIDESYVGGSMDEPGSIYMGAISQSGFSAPWYFEFQAENGPHELVAIGSANTAIVRGIEVGYNTQINVDTGSGAPNLIGNLTATNVNLPAETVRSSVTIYTQHDASTIFNLDTLTPTLVPPSLLLPGETEAITVTANAATETRSVETYDPTVTVFDLPPQITTWSLDTADVIIASWTALPLTGEVSLSVSQPNTGFGIAAIQVSPAYLAATGASSLAFDASAPGWQSDWSIWTDEGFAINFGVTQATTTGVISTSQWVPFIR